MDHVTIFLILYMTLLISCNGFDATQPNCFDVIDYGAVGDGMTDDSGAFLKAWTVVCGTDPSTAPTLIIPSGKTFLLKPMKFNGPCNHQNVNVEVSGNIVAPDAISGYEGEDQVWLYFIGIDRLNIYGTGQIDGRGSVWWQKSTSIYYQDEDQYEMSNQQRPTALYFHRCNGFQLSGPTI
ncbi:probable polygalacturonase At3g15720 isoform X2 [Macadamia integrifolia]|uniref:probable polygalacturonase At3g15720 isoform X2 n=1 Tax=Macadamia integrifolia TaxID=60698 RepID=UPI001C4FA3D7|nr:probable polygalacturonase At3g15720 isoform X2 [Macadamia integrifolia]